MTQNKQHTNEVFEAIGKTVVHFQQIELWLAEELASSLKMQNNQARFLLSAAMSFKQKIELLFALYPEGFLKREGLADVDLALAKKALLTAEEFRNQIVHSLWTVESGSDNAWIRSKGNIKSKYGFTFKSHKIDLLDLSACNDALIQIREWMICEKTILENATQRLKRNLNN